jgi:hypothetical protein
MVNKSKVKGSSYEAKIRDYLTAELKIEFKRMPLSGSLEYLKGDLWTPHDTAAWPYCIECKHYAEVNWNNLLTAKSTELLSFWKQAQREALVMKKKPLVIYRWNRSKDYVCWDDDISINHYIHCNVFDSSFKMGLLSDWIIAYKKTLLTNK